MIWRLMVIFILLLPGIQTLADSSGIYMTEGLMAYSLNFGNSPLGDSQMKSLISSETGLGYVFAQWLYFGGVFNYSLANEKNVDVFNVSYNHQETFQYYGPAIGYMGDNWFLIGHYYVAAEKKDSVTGNFITQNYDYIGTGFGINLGYKFSIGGFEVAPVIAYKNINYVNCKDPFSGATNACTPTLNQAEFTPYITLVFNFK